MDQDASTSAKQEPAVHPDGDGVVFKKAIFYPGDEGRVVEHLAHGSVHLENCKVNGLNFNDRDLRGLRVTKQTRFKNVTMERSDLSGAVFNNAHLQAVSFRESNMTAATIRGTRFNNADVVRTNLDRAIFIGNVVERSNMSEANLSAARVTGNSIYRTEMPYARFDGAVVAGNTFADVDLSHARAEGKSTIGGNNFARVALTASAISPREGVDQIMGIASDPSTAGYTPEQYAQYVTSTRHREY